MNSQRQRHWRLWAAALALLLSGPAFAFFPFGGFDSFEVLRFVRWPLSAFDNNNNGIVEADEGIEVLIEGGPSGFTATEIDIVEESMLVWEDVPTSYASFRTRGIVEDPILAGNTSTPDFLPSIVMQVTEADDTGDDVVPDPPDVVIPDVAFPVLGINLFIFTPEETILPINNQGVIIGAGTIIDSDVIINATAHRPSADGAAPLADLQATMVHELGHFLGFGHTPLNNLRPVQATPEDETFFNLVENPVFAFTGPDGIQRLIGVTPTMFPISFNFETLEGLRNDGGADLAPDDISAVSWSYPRGSQANFFSVQSEAHTETRDDLGLPSTPLVGGHIVAWADHDNDDNTPRIAMFNTQVGLYESPVQDQLEGRFNLIGMWKQFEIPGQIGGTFTPDYVFTVNPLNFSGFERQAPDGILPGDIDSTHLAELSSLSRSEDDYTNAFPSTVFHEVENILDIANKDAGTGMVWDFTRNTLVSQQTGAGLAEILVNRPMFGEEGETCPFNIIQGDSTGAGDTTDTTPPGEQQAKVGGTLDLDKLRNFRDEFLLRSAVGTWFANVYYHVAPSFAAFLLKNPTWFTVWKWFVVSAFWTMEHALMIMLGFVAVFAVLVALTQRARRAVAVSTLVVVGLFAVAPDASAAIAYVTTPELVNGADAIVTGKVLSTASEWTRGGRIYTNVVIQTGEAVKGFKQGEEGEEEEEEEGATEAEAEEEGEEEEEEEEVEAPPTITLRVIGGKVDGVVMVASEMPTFEKDDEVLLYLRESQGDLYVMYGGIRGRFVVLTSGAGKKYIAGSDPATKMALTEDALAVATKQKGAAAADAPEGGLELESYLNYLRGVVAQQEKAKRQ